MWGRTWAEIAFDVLLPETCAACREDLPPPLSGPLCGNCLRKLRPLSKERPRGGRGIRAIAAAYAYQGPVPGMIKAFKYGGRIGTGRVLGDWMAGLWPRKPELGSPHALVPVPLHPRRERFRGFNQTRILAQAVARVARTPLLEALVRTRDTPAQRGLPRARRLKQLDGAFKPKTELNLSGSKVLLIDDVLTTGGTLEACARALSDAGVLDVRCYVLAKRL